MIRLCLVVLLLFSSGLSAAVYQWVDENGKKHFSDTPPPDKTQAKDISDSLKPANIDESSSERRKLKEVFSKPSAAEQAYENNKKQQGMSEKEQQYCIYLRNRLQKISRRVMFVDDDGNDVKVSEQERKQRVKDLEKLIRKRCS